MYPAQSLLFLLIDGAVFVAVVNGHHAFGFHEVRYDQLQGKQIGLVLT